MFGREVTIVLVGGSIGGHSIFDSSPLFFFPFSANLPEFGNPPNKDLPLGWEVATYNDVAAWVGNYLLADFIPQVIFFFLPIQITATDTTFLVDIEDVS